MCTLHMPCIFANWQTRKYAISELIVLDWQKGKKVKSKVQISMVLEDLVKSNPFRRYRCGLNSGLVVKTYVCAVFYVCECVHTQLFCAIASECKCKRSHFFLFAIIFSLSSSEGTFMPSG